MATGLETPIILPLGPVQPRRLLDVIPRLPAIAGNPMRWIEGVTWEPWPCRALTVDNEQACDAAGQPVALVPAECEPHVGQASFRISDAMKFTTLDPAVDGMQGQLEARYNMQVSATFAHELLSGDGSGGMSLASEATPPNGQAFADPALSPWEGLSVLEEEIAERLQGGVGYIHVSPGILSRFVSGGVLHLNAVGMWETPAGNIVITDAGYINPPHPDAGGGASGSGTDWVYASGPVWFESTAPIFVGTGMQTFEGNSARPGTPWDRNVVLQYLNGYGILVFDPCPVTAVLIGFSEIGEPFGS
jgi:hypothetical protein